MKLNLQQIKCQKINQEKKSITQNDIKNKGEKKILIRRQPKIMCSIESRDFSF